MWDSPDSIGGPIHVAVPTATPLAVRDSSSIGERFRLTSAQSTRAIPITTVARTIFDAAATESPARLRQMIALAESHDLADSPSLPDLLERYPGAAAVGMSASRPPAMRSADGLASAGARDAFRGVHGRDRDLPRPLKNANVSRSHRAGADRRLPWPDVRPGRRARQPQATTRTGRQRKPTARATRHSSRSVCTPMRVTWRRLHRDRSELARELLAAIARGRRLTAHYRQT